MAGLRAPPTDSDDDAPEEFTFESGREAALEQRRQEEQQQAAAAARADEQRRAKARAKAGAKAAVTADDTEGPGNGRQQQRQGGERGSVGLGGGAADVLPREVLEALARGGFSEGGAAGQAEEEGAAGGGRGPEAPLRVVVQRRRQRPNEVQRGPVLVKVLRKDGGVDDTPRISSAASNFRARRQGKVKRSMEMLLPPQAVRQRKLSAARD